MISTTEFIDLLAAHRSGVRTMKTICCLLLTVVMAGVAVGKDNEPKDYYRRTIADELVSRTNQNLTLLNTQNPYTCWLSLSSVPGSPSKIALLINPRADKDQPTALQIEILEKYLESNLYDILLSMDKTGQPMPEYLQSYLNLIKQFQQDGNYSEKYESRELFQLFPFEIVTDTSS